MASTIGHPARPGQITATGLAHPETPAKALERALLAALRGAIAGRAAVLRGSRSAFYRQAQMRGEHATTLRDLAEIASDAPLVLVPLAGVLVAGAGHQVVPVHAAGPSCPIAAVRGALDAAHDLAGEMLEALKDGRLTPTEREGLLDRVRVALRRLCAADAALRVAA